MLKAKAPIEHIMLQSTIIDTKLGPMIAIGDDDALYLLEFTDRDKLNHQLNRIQQAFQAAITPGSTDPILSIESELNAYFNDNLTTFTTPIHITGTPFQEQAWKTLRTIPYGETRSYAQQATLLGKATAHRAVANANASNAFAIVVPCHRVIRSNGDLGGYAGGLDRKAWLIEHEQSH